MSRLAESNSWQRGESLINCPYSQKNKGVGVGCNVFICSKGVECMVNV